MSESAFRVQFVIDGTLLQQMTIIFTLNTLHNRAWRLFWFAYLRCLLFSCP